MHELKKWELCKKAYNAVEVLRRRKFDAHYAEDAAQAKAIVESLIPDNAKIAVGGSVTLQETGIMDLIKSGRYRFIDRFNNSSWEEELEKYRMGYLSDVFVTSSNAVTMEGQIVNIDCTGTNRICNIISIIDGCYKFPGRISVIVVGEELGF